MITFEIVEEFRLQVDKDLIEESIHVTLIHESAPIDSELTVVITTDEQLHALNYQFLHVDAPTDVLSFPVNYSDPDTGASYLGDILISYPRAASQANFGGHSIMAEIQLLVLHGILHLLGYDHAEPSDKAKMWATQREILRQLGLENLKMSEGE